jgi:hypothetical protein
LARNSSNGTKYNDDDDTHDDHDNDTHDDDDGAAGGDGKHASGEPTHTQRLLGLLIGAPQLVVLRTQLFDLRLEQATSKPNHGARCYNKGATTRVLRGCQGRSHLATRSTSRTE